MTFFRLSVVNAFSNSWKESLLCSIEPLPWDNYSLTSLVNIGISLASAVPTLVKYLLNSFAISISFLVIPCVVFIAGELDFFFYFPVISFIICHVHFVWYLYLFSKQAWQFFSDFILNSSKRFLKFLYFSSDLALLLFKNSVYKLCLVFEDFFSPLLNQGVFKVFRIYFYFS